MAIDDELGMMAHPRGVLDGRDRKALFAALEALVREDEVGRFLVGLPLDMKGGEGDGARRARGFAQALADATGCDVVLWDERLSTVEAKRALDASEVRGKKAKERIDEASACVLLQAWLDARARGEWQE